MRLVKFSWHPFFTRENENSCHRNDVGRKSNETLLVKDDNKQGKKSNVRIRSSVEFENVTLSIYLNQTTPITSSHSNTGTNVATTIQRCSEASRS